MAIFDRVKGLFGSSRGLNLTDNMSGLDKAPNVTDPKSSLGVVKFNDRNPPQRGTRELLDLYSQAPWLRAVVNKVGRSVATTDWKLFISTDAQDRAIRNTKLQRAGVDYRPNLIKGQLDLGNLREINEHPLLDLLNHGNDNLMGQQALQVTQHHLDLVGEAFWLMEKNQLGQPVAFWPLPPDWIKELPSKSHPFYRIGAHRGVETEVPLTEVLAFKDPDPANPYGRGSGIARSLGDEIEIDEYAAKHMKSFFYNRARPDIIIHGDSISDEDSKRLEQKWLSKHEGFWRAYKPLFFSRKIEIKELTQTFENLQMVSLRKSERDAIINVYGFPPEKFGIVGESKRSTIAAADFFWTKDILKPRIELLRDTMQEHLVPLYDDRLILDYNTPVIQDDEHELNVMSKAAFAFTIDDWRAKAGLPPLKENGNVLAIPMNFDLVDGDDPMSTPRGKDLEATNNSENDSKSKLKAVTDTISLENKAEKKAVTDPIFLENFKQEIITASSEALLRLADKKRRSSKI